jgi:GDP/UDP-N,N'-diacetylbacillosamine 2-epimerase (hydrolysing)
VKHVCVVTGTRAEYGLLRWLMEDLRESSDFRLSVIATGMHLSHEFAYTVQEIESDGFVVDKKVEMLLSCDSANGIAKSVGIGVIGFADAVRDLNPDIVVLLGDRYEMLSAAIACLIAGVPIAHLHGGETTEGAFDEAIRHSITKMSHLHFVAAEAYRRRVIQMGEDPSRVFLVGGLGVDAITRYPLMTKEELETALGFPLRKRNLLITFHPVTLDEMPSDKQLSELLAVLSTLEDAQLLFTLPNADTNHSRLTQLIKGFCSNHSNATVFSSLGQIRYLSCIKHFDGVIGNSSSGLLEVPSFQKGTVNIGSRQAGRLRAASVIDCEANFDSIASALNILFSDEFQKSLRSVKNPYGKGGASRAIIRILRDFEISVSGKKVFFDLPDIQRFI